MTDIYAFIRKMTNHELISARDAKALTDAVDGLIDEIDSRQMRINELNETNSALEAENERLRNMLNGYGKLDAELAIAERRIEALSRTGAVKVKALDEDDFFVIISAAAINMRKAASGIRGQVITVQDSIDWWVMKETERRILSALEPAAPEGQQEVSDG